MPSTGPPTILFEVFWANQSRMRLIETAVQGTGLPAEDYPFYVLIGAEGPWTPTDLAGRMDMPLTTVLYRAKRIERRGHVERVDNPEDGRSFLLGLTSEGSALLGRARPAFRDLAEAVEARLGADAVTRLRDDLIALRGAIDEELEERRATASLAR